MANKYFIGSQEVILTVTWDDSNGDRKIVKMATVILPGTFNTFDIRYDLLTVKETPVIGDIFKVTLGDGSPGYGIYLDEKYEMLFTLAEVDWSEFKDTREKIPYSQFVTELAEHYESSIRYR